MVFLPLVVLAVGFVAAGIGWSRRTPTHLTPLLQGHTVADARRAAEALHFVVVERDPVFDATVALGTVISQDPADGVRLKERRSIAIVVSKGVEPVPVPDLAGLSFDAASGALRALNLRISTPPITEDSDTIPDGTVIRWSPVGAVPPGTAITVVVSSGPPTVEVPRLVGLAEADALAGLPPGLTPEIVRVANDAPKGSVYSLKPAAGEIVAKGTTVKVYVSAGPAYASVPNVINLLPADASAALRKAGFKVGNTIGPADQPVLHTRPLRNTRQRLGSVVTLYTTEESVPEVPAGLLPTPTTEPTEPTTTPVAKTTVKP
jgi:eukaryotic-like serine/threonine-protein kinase